ncbi:zinc finger protein 135-like [Corythoichthys intestinalis]|uniref:zinc finger protein 135-like n=1 Tax=Corythoichthys intestinalis TaxID=161448 RepID=UPI0025A60460|nr:zinc finger protein 135-like [Corythoichthys intestinalis]
MRARPTPAAKFEAELCGATDLRQHQRSTSCKIQVVPCTLPDLYVSQAHRPEHQGSACIKEEEESGPIQGFSKYLIPEWHESESPGVKEEVGHPHMKQEEPEHPQQQKTEVQLPIKKEEVELLYVKEEDDITMSTGELLNSEDGPSEASRGTEPPSSSSTEGSQVHIFIAPTDRRGATSHSPYRDDGHKKSHHDNKLLKCSECGKTFAYKYACRMHMRSHTGEKPFGCSVCGQRFAQKDYLTKHTRTHTGEKPFICSVCGQGFSQKQDLKRHMRTHTGEKPFSCSVCGQGFARKQYLIGHTRTHTGEKPFSCSDCGQGFTQIHSLRVHTRTHTGEKPFSCSV